MRSTEAIEVIKQHMGDKTRYVLAGELGLSWTTLAKWFKGQDVKIHPKTEKKIMDWKANCTAPLA